MARVVGALPTEVALLNSLTVNLHLLLASFFRPDGRRRRILTDGPLFPSDRHALTSHLAGRGLDPERDLVVVGPRTGEFTVRTEDLEARHRRRGRRDRAGLPRRRQLRHRPGPPDRAADRRRPRRRGARRLGPGPRRRQHRAGAPRLGRRRRRLVHLQVPERRAGLGRRDLRPRAPRAEMRRCPGWAAGGGWIRRSGSTPTRRSCRRWARPAGRPRRRRSWPSPRWPRRSRSSTRSACPTSGRGRSRLTGYLEGRIDRLGVEIVTPRDPASRGAQLSLRFDDAGSVLHRLAARGVVADHRAPDLIRVAPIPSYTSYHDLWRFGEILRETIAGA